MSNTREPAPETDAEANAREFVRVLLRWASVDNDQARRLLAQQFGED